MNLRYVMFSLMLGLAVPLTAQNTAEFLTTLQESTSILARGNAVVVSGWDYRATVDAQGMTFTPALGSAAATTQTLSLAPRRFGRAGSMHEVGVTAPHISGKVVGQQQQGLFVAGEAQRGEHLLHVSRVVGGVDAQGVAAGVGQSASGNIDDEMPRVLGGTLLVEETVLGDFRSEGMIFVERGGFLLALRLAHF